MSIRAEYFCVNTLTSDLFSLFAGEQLGSGIARQVWSMEGDPASVLKFETGAGSFQNVAEWEVWQALQHHEPSAKWLAPCRRISPCGAIMIQARTEPIRRAELPDKVPAWASDLKLANWGIYDGRPVMHDYGLLSVMVGRAATKQMKKADWFA
ncbi:hypothetical protein ACFPIF_15565 [Brevundimonas faecalis]|uniref:hypothetical protein n=1 Tax=Brevundimonas faecalis TaxID=947378 RepID=UPI003620E714